MSMDVVSGGRWKDQIFTRISCYGVRSAHTIMGKCATVYSLAPRYLVGYCVR